MMNSDAYNESFGWALVRVAQRSGIAFDTLQLQSALGACAKVKSDFAAVRKVCQVLEIAPPRLLKQPDRARLPLLLLLETSGWGVVFDQHPDGGWVAEFQDGKRILQADELVGRTAYLSLASTKKGGGGTFRRALQENLKLSRGAMVEAAIGSLLIGAIALATSLFSMQVYDRVIPTRNENTLIVLSSGVALTIVLEMVLKFARSAVMDSVAVALDARLSRDIFHRLLSVRIDSLPGSVGGLASQLRGYEQVRSFYTANTLFNLVDLPIGLILLLFIAVIGSPIVAAVPLLFGGLAISLGLLGRTRMNELASHGAKSSNKKTGLLVETIEGAETIKAGSGGWKFLSRWIDVNAESLSDDLRVRKISEGMGYVAVSMQQLAYAGIVIAGAVVVMQGGMTTGALIACSILGGRVMAPFLMIPGLIAQRAQAEAAIASLEHLYCLKLDDAGERRALTPESLKGTFQFTDVSFSYVGAPPAIRVKDLRIKAGERVGILGPIGAGKSTLLRLMAGLYAPQTGRILIDGMDINQISRQVLSQKVGYLQQEHRLFQGTLRENLLIGTPDPGDTVMQEVLQRSGLDQLVASHPLGLDLPIAEGGKGLSGGQRQLVAFTRLLLSQPSVYLLDEPMASMDEAQERHCLNVLAQDLLNNARTLVLVTHKPSNLKLVNRVIVVVGQQVFLDGPRDEVLTELNRRTLEAAKAEGRALAHRQRDGQPLIQAVM